MVGSAVVSAAILDRAEEADLCPRALVSEPPVHDMEADVSVRRVLKGLRHRGKDLEAERAPQPDRRRIGFDNRIELHRPVAVCTCLV